MMENIFTFFTTMLAALAVENAVFVRGLGINRWVSQRAEFGDLLWYGGYFTWMSLWSTLGSLLMIPLVEKLPIARFLYAPGFLLVVVLCYVGTYYLSGRAFPSRMEKISWILPITTFNTALFGVFYVVLNRNYTVLRALAYSLGSGVGYTLALLIILFARKRLALCPATRSFRGTPLLLTYIGLLSLALYGLLGYGAA